MKQIFLFILLLNSYLSYAIEVKVIGNKKTSTKKIVELALVHQLKKFDKKELELIEQRLLRTGLFVDAKAKFKGKTLYIEIEDRWTLIPILKFASGGGVTHTTAGIYEANLFGRIKELGTQYERLGGTNSGVAWFKDSLFFDSKTGIDLQLWKVNRLRTKYNQDLSKPTIVNGFLHQRENLLIGINRFINDHLNWSLSLEYHNDSFSNKLVPDGAKSKNNGQNLPPSTEFFFVGLSSDIGLIKKDRHLQDGNQFNLKLRHGFSSTHTVKDFTQFDLAWSYFQSLGINTFAQRIMTGMTNTDALQYWNYLGGLDRIRGFADNRFAGRYYFLSNTEYRHSIVNRTNWVLQLSTFFDAVAISEYFRDLGELTATSAGIGFRVILPKIYRFVFRFDYAKPLKKSDDNAISFGVQQFF